MSASLPSLAFAGLGLMGVPMCRRLLAAGYPLAVWNRSPGKRELLAAEGAKAVEVPAELAADAEILMLCLADTAAVREVVFGAGGIVENARPGQLLVDFSSAEPAATREMAAQPGDHGRRTRSGYRTPAAGPLPAWPAPDAHGRGGRRAGDQGLQPDDRCLQRPGDRRSGGAGGAGRGRRQPGRSGAGGRFADSKPLQILAPQMAESRYEPVKWHIRTLLKDLDTAVKLSREQGAATPMSGLAAQLMRLHGSQGYLERDPATLVEQYRTAVE
ncbi:putative 3-hydroxyisobutyrate dehydrogenase [Pseudomonas aeruginosa VRFPA02]|nr:putative 3-hydroxyisobutyrate dehydrogenase [Pseudomonas aeruginosa VRFPA02]